MAAGKQLHGNFTPAHDAGCAAQCFEGVQRGNLIILPVNPRPQAATRTGENLRDTEQRIANLALLEKQLETYRKQKHAMTAIRSQRTRENSGVGLRARSSYLRRQPRRSRRPG